jgi:hypothetical protein
MDDAARTTQQRQEDLLYIPRSLDEMVKQASLAMEDAMKLGKKRQILRILLPRSADNDQLLQYYEASDVDSITKNANLILCPTDETWQGGIMQLYRAASYASQEILRYVVLATGIVQLKRLCSASVYIYQRPFGKTTPLILAPSFFVDFICLPLLSLGSVAMCLCASFFLLNVLIPLDDPSPLFRRSPSCIL